MGKWSDRYLNQFSDSLPESTAKNCQNSDNHSELRVSSAIGSGFQQGFENNHSNSEKKRVQIPLTGFTAKTDKTRSVLLADFCRLTRNIGIDQQVLLKDSEILAELDADGIEDLKTASLEVRQSWAGAIALRLIRHRGIVPTGWTKIAHCYFCGPVFSYHDLNMLSCDWCDMRETGKSFPQPK